MNKTQNLILLSAQKMHTEIEIREVSTFSALQTLKIYLHFLWLFIPIFSRFSHQITVNFLEAEQQNSLLIYFIFHFRLMQVCRKNKGRQF